VDGFDAATRSHGLSRGGFRRSRTRGLSAYTTRASFSKPAFVEKRFAVGGVAHRTLLRIVAVEWPKYPVSGGLPNLTFGFAGLD
jgi:hypothetical protein